jgi:hypothetical protein
MYTLIRTMPLRRLLLDQVPTLGLALLIAEVGYKFHSFLLETLAFLATWYAADAARQWLADHLGPGRARAEGGKP